MSTLTVPNKYTYDLHQFVVFHGDIYTYLKESEQDLYIQANLK
jgi:hypothetical protein